MPRMIRIGLMAMLTGAALLLAAPRADADKLERGGVKLADSPISGVVLKSDGRIEIDAAKYTVEQSGDTLTLFGKGKKKGGGGTVGISCSCSEGGGCGIRMNTDGTASCTGSSCCGWIKIAGDPLVKEDGVLGR